MPFESNDTRGFFFITSVFTQYIFIYSVIMYMQWTDRIRQVKIILVAAAMIIAVVSLVVSHILVDDMKVEEKNNMEVWAKA